MQMPDAVVLRRTADLVPYANNARTHTPEQVKQIAASERRAARGRDPLRAGRGRDRDRNDRSCRQSWIATRPGPAAPHGAALYWDLLAVHAASEAAT